LKRTVLEYKYEQPVKSASLDEGGQEQTGQILSAEKLPLARDIVHNILDLVSQLADYRLSIESVYTLYFLLSHERIFTN
jgi:hypothetical protein